MLDELEVLGLELLTGSLKTVDLLKLGLLLGQGLADDLAGLGIGLVADAVSILVGVVDDALGGLLGSNQGSGNLTLLSGEVGCGSGHGSGGNGLSGSVLSLGKLSLRVGKLLLGGSQTTLKIDNLGKHSVNLGGQRLQKDVDLGGIIAALSLRESLSLDVSRGNSHNKFSFFIASAPGARRKLLSQFYTSIPIRSCRISLCTNCNAIIATTGEKSTPPIGGINRRNRLSHGPQTLSSTAAISCSSPPCFMGIHVIKQ